MIYIVTGPINSGKTSWILRDFNLHPGSDGFACKKVWVEGQHIGYDLFHLPTGLVCPFIRNPGNLPPKWEEAALLADRYSFSSAGFLFARHLTQNAILNNVRRFYLDEVGPLELAGKGFALLLEALLGAQIDLVLVVREALVQQMVEKYQMSGHTLIQARNLSV